MTELFFGQNDTISNKKYPDRCLDATVIGTGEFIAHGQGWNYFLNKMILLVIKK
jgi:hypothetical protein